MFEHLNGLVQEYSCVYVYNRLYTNVSVSNTENLILSIPSQTRKLRLNYVSISLEIEFENIFRGKTALRLTIVTERVNKCSLKKYPENGP